QIAVVAGEQQAEGLSDAARRAGDQCGLCHDGAPFVPDALRPSSFSRYDRSEKRVPFGRLRGRWKGATCTQSG
ncbi:MAG: hypothetical protein ACLU7P_07540, partial [Eggerthella lenta]